LVADPDRDRVDYEAAPMNDRDDRDDTLIPGAVAIGAFCVVWGVALGIATSTWERLNVVVHVSWIAWLVFLLATIWILISASATTGTRVVTTLALLVSVLPVGFVLIAWVSEEDSIRETSGARPAGVRVASAVVPVVPARSGAAVPAPVVARPVARPPAPTPPRPPAAPAGR
jgi:hypothetical protein